jgi:ubiquitin carboxyl-terminal hydrolase 1
MSTWQQQDAQEYFSNVLDQVDKEVVQKAKRRMLQNSGLEKISLAGTAIEAKAVASSTSSRAHKSNPLEGLLAQRVGCTKCGYSDGLSMIPFNNLTVPLGARSLYDMRDCLDEYSKLEYIEGVQCPKCTLLLAQDKYIKMLDKKPPESLANDIRHRLRFVEEALEDEDFSDASLVKKCNIPKKQWVSSTKSKQAVIGRAPKTFIIHINRSIFNEYTGTQEKNNAAVRFPLFFNLDTWCLGKSSDFAEENAHIENWSMDPNESMLADPESLPGDENDQLRSPSNYELRAVVTHFGRHENGHYVCYRKAAFSLANGDSVDGDLSMNEPPSEAKEAWWRLSDEDVTLVSEEYVLRQGGVFMLFYECIDGSETPLQPLMQVEEICVGVAKPAEVDMEEIAQIPLPDDCDKDFESLDELSIKTNPSLAPWTLSSEQVPPPDTSSSPRQENSDESAPAEHEEQHPTLIDSATETETEDLFQSATAATGITPAPSRERIRMRTSSAFTASSSAEDPLQIPMRMGTAF